MEAAERIVPMRTQRFLARAGVASRRGSENLMTAGRVSVNGQIVTELGSKVDPLTDEVRVDGKLVSLGERPSYLILNKPAGYLTTMADPQGRPTVAELVASAELPGLFPVGRLDQDTTGLLLFTTDGLAGQVLLHPRHHVEKCYLALVQGRPHEAELDRLRTGITLDDGPCAPAEAWCVADGAPEAAAVAPAGVPQGCSVCGIRIHEGRKHQVKRMFAAIGHPVRALHRQSFGPLELGELEPGCYRAATQGEIAALEELVRQATEEDGR